MFKIRSNAGFTIVEVLIASALMGAVALGIAKMSKDQSKSAKTVESRFEISSTVSEMTQLLSNKESCSASFGGRNINTAAGVVTNIYERPVVPPDILKYVANTSNTGPVYGNNTYRITSFVLSAVNDGTGVGMIGTTNEGVVNLIVTYYMGADNTFGAKSLPKKIRLRVKTALDLVTITECVAVGGLLDDYVNVIGDEMTGNLVMLGNAEIDLQSDRRLKHDIKKIKSSLAKVRQLNPVTFKWNESNDLTYGFIAQEVERHYPLMVSENKSGFKKISYFQFTPLIVRSIQELDEENKMLKGELATLKAEQAQLKKMVEQLVEQKK